MKYYKSETYPLGIIEIEVESETEHMVRIMDRGKLRNERKITDYNVINKDRQAVKDELIRRASNKLASAATNLRAAGEYLDKIKAL